MLYKVTPMMTPPVPEKKVREPGQPRKKRKSAVYDHEGNEVFLTLMCMKCRNIRPLQQFGLRKMADGVIRNQPWCRTCRSGAGTKKTASEQAPVAPDHDTSEEPSTPEAAAHAESAAAPVAG